MKKRTFVSRLCGLLCLSLTIFSCELHTSFEPTPDYESILTSHKWVVTGAVYTSPRDLSSLILTDLKDYLNARKFDYTHVTDVYRLMEESFPCVLDNTYRFDKASQQVIVNTGDVPCVGLDPFTNYEFYNELPQVDLSKNDWYTVSFMPPDFTGAWSLNKEKGQLYVYRNHSIWETEKTFDTWTIKTASHSQIVLQTVFHFRYQRQDGSLYTSSSEGYLVRLTLKPSK